MEKDFDAEWVEEIDRLTNMIEKHGQSQAILQIADEIVKLRRECERGLRFSQVISQALNEGPGVYQP